MAYTTIDKSSLQFNTKLYTGSGGTNNITGLDFQPDWVWLKSRSATASNVLQDAIRGNNKSIKTNTTAAEFTQSFFTSFNSDGFTVATTEPDVNANGTTYASWNWKANGQGSSNTAGTINTSYTSANTTSGFSIIQYTGNGSSGATIGHGLGVVPKAVIVKLTSGSGYDWGVYHASLGNTKNLRLNLTDTVATSTAFWNDTTPSSSLVYLGNNATVNGSGSTYIAYCFADVPGFSKMGSYQGNANANGSFIYTGFRPAFLVVKNTQLADNWSMFNSKALGYNTYNHIMYPDLANTESNGLPIDFLANGFKWRTAAGMANGNNQKLIYMAFAANPFVTSTGVPTTAN